MIRQLILLFPLTVSLLVAGEKPAVHLTGNPAIDFFSSKTLAGNPIAAVRDTDLASMQTSPPEKEKSPLVAGILSLVIPGAGEVYSKSYLKGALFFAAELTCWGVAYSYDKQAKRQTTDFQAFANSHWSAVRYANWTLKNLPVLNSTLTQSETDYGDKIYPDGYDPADPPSVEGNPPPFRNMDWNEQIGRASCRERV